MKILGAKKFAVVLVTFQDSSATLPFTLLQVKAAWGDISRYWEYDSYDRVSLFGSEIFDWKTYPSTRADFTAAHLVLHLDGTSTLDRAGMIASVRTTFAIDENTFEHIIVIFSEQVGTAWTDGGTILEPSILAGGIICHEMTHQFGEPDHSYDMTTRELGARPGEYWDQTDVMSAQNCWYFAQNAADPFSGSGPHHCMFWKDKFGWLDGARISRIPAPALAKEYDQSFTLYSRSSPVLERLACVQVRDLWIELDRNDSPADPAFFDQFDNGLPTSGVAIHRERTLDTGNRVPVILVPDVDDNPDQKLWAAGSVFRDHEDDDPLYIWVKTIDPGDASAVVNVSNTYPPPLTRHRVVAIRVGHSTAGGGFDYISEVGILDASGSVRPIHRYLVHRWIEQGRNSFFVLGSNGTQAEVVNDEHWIATHPDSDPANNLLSLPHF